MKSRVKKKEDHFLGGQVFVMEANEKSVTRQQKDPKIDLMARLAMGQKVQVDKKEMKRLTSKNYQNLPEIKKKQEEEKKR